MVSLDSPIYEGDMINRLGTDEITEANDEWNGDISDEWGKVVYTGQCNSAPNDERSVATGA